MAVRPATAPTCTYDHEALIGILALEAARAGVVVIGEDLGDFEPGCSDYLAERGILGTSILWFEYDGDAPLPAGELPAAPASPASPPTTCRPPPATLPASTWTCANRWAC